MNIVTNVTFVIYICACQWKRNDSANVGFDLLYTSVDKEVHNYNCSVHGALPKWITGTLVSAHISY